MAAQRFQLNSDYIELYALIKLYGLAPSGGAAKSMIAAGEVLVDGVTETRKACKIRDRQIVSVAGEKILVLGPASEATID